ncbi:MAG: 50S ribosomal protein L1 [Candidatus Marinimicrobia bacterium]|nr:50S ribosomal protein L1 [Candidatus Neomarinimicrobiota bacterium]
MKRSKRYKEALSGVDRFMEYSLEKAIDVVKAFATSKFDETVEVAINLGVNPKHADQNIRLTTSLPHGTGKKVRILVLAKGAMAKEGKEMGADYVGDDEYLQKLSGGWDEIDIIVATPDMMPKLGKLGRILGPKGLMPNPKSGTITQQVGKTVNEIKAGRIELRVDSNGIVHTAVGKCSFNNEELGENIKSIVSILMKVKPAAVKGTYFKKLTLSSTMGPGVKVDKATVV